MCATSAFPVQSITTPAFTTPRVPSGSTTTRPFAMSRPRASRPSVSTPSACAPKRTVASAFVTIVLRIHSAFAIENTHPAESVPGSTLFFEKPRLHPL